jgi:hypothetical protein
MTHAQRGRNRAGVSGSCNVSAEVERLNVDRASRMGMGTPLTKPVEPKERHYLTNPDLRQTRSSAAQGKIQEEMRAIFNGADIQMDSSLRSE